MKGFYEGFKLVLQRGFETDLHGFAKEIANSLMNFCDHGFTRVPERVSLRFGNV